MKRILFYCQHLIGVGHLTRSLALCEVLADSFEIDLLQGGPDIGLGFDKANFRGLKIPPLLMREEDSSLYDPAGQLGAAEVLERRREAIDEATRGRRYDHLIVELFPFGRRKFRHEILWLMDRLRGENPGLRAHCSLRDIMIEREPAREAETVAWLNERFDDVLIHSDPRFFRLEDSFGSAGSIEPRLVYTGFVSAKTGRAVKAARSQKVLVSLGGGLVGGELALAAVEAAALLPSYEFDVALGPNLPEPIRAQLAAQARGRRNVRFVGFLRDFQGALSGAGLSVSLAGYNTVMDLLRTRTPGVVYPYGANREQSMRARRFEAAGLLAVASEKDLARKRFAALLRRELRCGYPEVDVDLSGAERTRDYLLGAP